MSKTEDRMELANGSRLIKRAEDSYVYKYIYISKFFLKLFIFFRSVFRGIWFSANQLKLIIF